jgi:prefoldin subunit 5
MADEKVREEFLQEQLDQLDEEIKTLAAHMEELAGLDCDFGACVFDPALDTVEKKIDEVQRRRDMVATMMKTLKECKPS